MYFACPKLEAVLERSTVAGAEIEEEIRTWPWGEGSFYARDPLGNPICLVEEGTHFTGGASID